MTWISVQDALPKDEKQVLINIPIHDPREYMARGRINWTFQGSFSRSKGWFVDFPPRESFWITHWMPLPELPK